MHGFFETYEHIETLTLMSFFVLKKVSELYYAVFSMMMSNTMPIHVLVDLPACFEIVAERSLWPLGAS